VAAIDVRRLRKQFGPVTALDEVSLAVAHGEFVTLLGPSGCGKTTVLRCLAGLERPDGGEIRIGDRLVMGAGTFVPPEQRQVGMVFQSYAVWPHMTVYENLAFGLTLQKLSRDEIRTRITRVLDVVNLTGLMERYPSQLSGGQQQRVAVARTLVLEPQVLLFDEPLSNLDAKLRERMRTEIRQLQRTLGITAVYVTHDQAEAMAISDRIVLLDRGRIVQTGSPRQLYYRPVNRFACDFVGIGNLLPGQVEAESRDRSSEVRLAGGLSIRAYGGERLTPGQPVTVLIRPEQLAIARGEGIPGWRGRVQEATFMGDHRLYAVDVQGIRLLVKASPANDLEPGTAVVLQLLEPACYALPGHANEKYRGLDGRR
jgi:iron(III) transport system ATP-binding protein